MREPDDKRKRSPVDRFRKILSDEKDQAPAVETRKPAVVNLPRAKASDEVASQQQPVRGAAALPRAESRGKRFLPAFWTIASFVSLVANAVLFVILLSLLRGVGALNSSGPGPGPLSGLYNSLQQMDRAHIRTTIPVHSDIALDISVPVQTATKITLARDVAIQGAHVKINTPLFNIDAPASVTLPAGTSLDVALDFKVPLQTSVPIAVDVPVDIAVQDTDLHPAILGLQDAIRPLLCAASPNALTQDGSAICP